MSPLTSLHKLFSRLLHPPTGLDEELAFHIDQSTQQKISQGLPPQEARRLALIEFGSVERTRDQCRQQRPLWWVETVLQDARYALRSFRRNPIFTVATILTLALAIGATTAVLSVVDRILFRSLPYAHAERLVSVGLTAPISPSEFMLGGSFYDWRDHQTPFQAFAAEGLSSPCDLSDHNPARLTCATAEAALLPTLGIAPRLGRNFLPDEDRPNGPKVALISYALWRAHYNLDPSVLNRIIELNGKPVRIIGVLPNNFELPDLLQADILLPLALDPATQRKQAPGEVLYAFARLKPGVSIAQATAQLQPVFQYSLSLAPAPFRKEVHYIVRPLRERQMHDVRTTAWVLLASVLSLLSIACANVACLFLTRAATHQRELAVRSALGAARGRLIRQTLTEALILTLTGAAAGCLLAELLLRIFLSIAPAGVFFLTQARLDLRILLFTLLLSLACGLLCGLIPALQKPRPGALAARSTHSRSHAILRRTLVVAQIAISMILLSTATLLLRSFRNLQLQHLGIETRGVLTAGIVLPPYRYSTPQQQMNFFLQAEAACNRLPGVQSVALSDSLPPSGNHREQIYSNLRLQGRPRPTSGTGGMVTWRWVTPSYFSALQIPILRGRAFTQADRTSQQPVIILSRLLASRLFGVGNPIGQRIQPTPQGPWFTIVGIAADVKNAGLASPPSPEFYQLRRSFPQDWDLWGATLLLATAPPAAAHAATPQTLLPWVRTQLSAIDPTLPITLQTLTAQVSQLAGRPRFESALLSFFALTGLILAIIGLYGVTAFMVTERTPELAIRIALGATQTNILHLVLRDALQLIATGSLLGLGVALTVSNLLQSLLFQVAPHDPAIFATAAISLATATLAATLLPAHAATKLDPTLALRSN